MIPGFRNIELRTKPIERIQSPEASSLNDNGNENSTETNIGNLTDTNNVYIDVNVNVVDDTDTKCSG